MNGLLIPPGEPRAFTYAMIRILENPELADQFREAGLKIEHKRLSWDKISDQFVEIYQKLSVA